MISWPPSSFDWQQGVFDSASQEQVSICGASALIVLDQDRHINLWMNCGMGTNTRGELMALWLVLYYAKLHHLALQHIAGDSKLIINWAYGKWLMLFKGFGALSMDGTS